jgi:hypothetical protein
VVQVGHEGGGTGGGTGATPLAFYAQMARASTAADLRLVFTRLRCMSPFARPLFSDSLFLDYVELDHAAPFECDQSFARG